MRAFALGVAMIAASIGLAAPAAAQKLEIIEAGTYAVEKGNCARDLRGILICERIELRLQHATSQVPAAINVEFGVRYRVTGVTPGKPVAIRRVWRLPEPGFLPPNKPAIQIMERFDRLHGDYAIDATYGFDDEWELVTGDWVLEFWHGQDKLGEQTFTVLRPVS
jgi:hypothetical protein